MEFLFCDKERIRIAKEAIKAEHILQKLELSVSKWQEICADGSVIHDPGYDDPDLIDTICTALDRVVDIRTYVMADGNGHLVEF